MNQAIFAAGCFWGVEEFFLSLKGVIDTKVGYIGGKIKNPTYKQVCIGDTGHAEGIRVEFEPKIISYEQLLEAFFRCHNPTELNRQGVDVGTQYRSAIFYLDDQQKKMAIDFTQTLQKKINKIVATEISPAGVFYLAEDYHQRYIRKQSG